MLLKIFKQDLKESFKTWIICALTLNILFILIYFASGTMKTRGAFLVEQFYTMFATIVPLIFVIGTANRLVVSQVDDGSLFMVMVAGYKRSQIIFTKIVFYVISIFLMHLLLMVVSFIMIWVKPLSLIIMDAFLLNVFAFLITLAIGSVCLFASVFFNSKKNASLLGTGFPLVSYLLYTLAHMFTNIPNLEDEPLINILTNLKYVSIYSLFDYQLIIDRSSWLILIGLCLFIATTILFTLSGIIFKKKDLAL